MVGTAVSSSNVIGVDGTGEEQGNVNSGEVETLM